jgi:hypothetical protein
VTRQPDFRGVWIKVERAKEHISDLEARAKRFEEAEPYSVVSYCELDTGHLVFKVRGSDQPPLKWSAIAGDAIHNLRSALDLLVCEVVRANDNPVFEGTGFPVFKSAKACADEFKGRPPGQVKGAPQRAVDFIKKASPYKGANNPFWRLHQLDIEDKHKLLVVVVMEQGFGLHILGAINTVEVFLPNNVEVPLKDGTEIYRIAARGVDDPVAQMRMYPKFAFGVAFGEVEVVKGKPLVPTLHEIAQFVESFIESFVTLFGQNAPSPYCRQGGNSQDN